MTGMAAGIHRRPARCAVPATGAQPRSGCDILGFYDRCGRPDGGWDGAGWSPASSPNASAASTVLTGVSADSATDAWAVGYYISKGVRYALILH